MSLPIAITDLLRGHAVEWERLEFKKGWNPLDVLHTLCAFANDFHNLGGGYIVIGIEDQNGRPVLPPAGLTLEEVDQIQKELLNLGHSAIRPPYHALAAPYEIHGRLVLVLWAPGGRTRPYRARVSLSKEKSDELAWFIRKGSSTVRARGADETELMGLAATVPFDDRENIFAGVDALSHDLMTDYLREVRSDLAKDGTKLRHVELCRRMGIVGGTTEAPYPINVGLLFFTRDPRKYFPATQIDVVWFPEGRGGNRFTEREFRGPLHLMIRDVLRYIETTFISTTVVKHPDRAEADRIKNYPFEAIEEAVVNAVYHRGYDIREPIEVSITREQLTVLSYPGPDRSIRQEDLAAGRAISRRYRNRRIGEFLKELDLTEGRGTGIPKILRAMRLNGSPPPIFQFDEDHSYFATILPVHPEVLAATEGGHDELQIAGQVSEHVAAVVTHIEGEMTRRALQSVLGLDDREYFRQAYLVPALQAGAIEMLHPDRPNSRSQRYRLSNAGRMLLHDIQSDSLEKPAQVPERVAAIVSQIEGEMTRQALQAALDLDDRKNFRRSYLAPALKAGFIEMIEPDKPNSREQRYRLTPAGKRLRRQWERS